jgi:hypothetical protein
MQSEKFHYTTDRNEEVQRSEPDYRDSDIPAWQYLIIIIVILLLFIFLVSP